MSRHASDIYIYIVKTLLQCFFFVPKFVELVTLLQHMFVESARY